MANNGKNNNEETAENTNFTDGFGYGFNFGCNDIPEGFQNINPEFFIVIAELLGNAVAGKLPFNVQNAVGNWLELVGQTILTYNSQQQYFQGGPGRYFNPIYYNVSNPFCQDGSTSTEGNTSSGAFAEKDVNTKKKQSATSTKDNINVSELKQQIAYLEQQINNIKSKLDNI